VLRSAGEVNGAVVAETVLALARTMGTGVVMALTMATMAEAEFAVLVPVAAMAASDSGCSEKGSDS
jgi:hypothetical protein